MLRPQYLTKLCYGAMMALAIGINLLPVFLITLSETYGGVEGLTKEQLGRLGAALFTGLVGGILITGPLADRWGSKPFVLLGNGLSVFSLVAMAFAPNYTLLSVALCLLGMGAGMLDMILSPIVAAINPMRRSAAMNWLHSFYCIGAGVTILMGTIVLELGGGWRTACLILVPLPIILLLLFVPLTFPPMVHETQRTGLRFLLRQRWFLIALLALFLGGATELGMAQWLPAYAETSLGYAPWVGGAGLFLFSLAMAAGRMVVGAFENKLDPYRAMAWGSGLSVLLFLGASFIPHPLTALICCICVGFTGSCLWPTMLAVSANRFPLGGATLFGTLAAFGNAGGIFMPWMVGGVADMSNLHWGLAISSLAPLGMLPLVLLLRRKE